MNRSAGPLRRLWLVHRRGWNRRSITRIRPNWFTSCSLRWASSSRRAATRTSRWTLQRRWLLRCWRRPPSRCCRTASRRKRWNCGRASVIPGPRRGRFSLSFSLMDLNRVYDYHPQKIYTRIVHFLECSACLVLPLKWPILCRVGRSTLLTHTLLTQSLMGGLCSDLPFQKISSSTLVYFCLSD